ncbi:methyltransferase domain-containing protein [Streptomyces sp. NBC_00096]|uniref:methyltransferase domain-containing protein n=1 Tax=Streptomyces sp. NBC_00096 TaxID=2975650 RepID=UPI003245706C
MNRDERLLHGAAAVAYSEHRPDCARAAVHWALGRPAPPPPGPRALDLGAGTGRPTAALVALGAEAVAVEPDPAMLSELRRSLPGRPSPAGQCRGDTAAGRVRRCRTGRQRHAVHWFDMAVAGPEIAGVLAPGGILAGLWNGMDGRGEGAAGLAPVSGSAAVGPRDTPAARRVETAGAHLPKTGGAARFDSPEQTWFPYGQAADSLATRAGVRHAGRRTGSHAGPDPRLPRADRRRPAPSSPSPC